MKPKVVYLLVLTLILTMSAVLHAQAADTIQDSIAFDSSNVKLPILIDTRDRSISITWPSSYKIINVANVSTAFDANDCEGSIDKNTKFNIKIRNFDNQNTTYNYEISRLSQKYSLPLSSYRLKNYLRVKGIQFSADGNSPNLTALQGLLSSWNKSMASENLYVARELDVIIEDPGIACDLIHNELKINYDVKYEENSEVVTPVVLQKDIVPFVKNAVDDYVSTPEGTLSASDKAIYFSALLGEKFHQHGGNKLSNVGLEKFNSFLRELMDISSGKLTQINIESNASRFEFNMSKKTTVSLDINIQMQQQNIFIFKE